MLTVPKHVLALVPRIDTTLNIYSLLPVFRTLKTVLLGIYSSATFFPLLLVFVRYTLVDQPDQHGIPFYAHTPSYLSILLLRDI